MNVVYVDQNDEVIGAGPVSDAIDRGIVVRIARVFLQNNRGELLIQKRSPRVSSLPGRWDQTAAGHVDEGEDYAQAAARELDEEMGIRGVELSEVAKFYTEETDESKIKKRFNQIFAGVYDGEVKIDSDEVSGYRWVFPHDLEHEMELKPDDFTEGFIRAYQVYQKVVATQ